MKIKSLLVALTGLVASAAFADEGAAQAVQAASSAIDLTGFGVGLGFGLAIMGAGLGQSKSASAALEGMARNPAAAKSLFTPMILALVFTESLVLFGFALAFLKIK